MNAGPNGCARPSRVLTSTMRSPGLLVRSTAIQRPSGDHAGVPGWEGPPSQHWLAYPAGRGSLSILGLEPSACATINPSPSGMGARYAICLPSGDAPAPLQTASATVRAVPPSTGIDFKARTSIKYTVLPSEENEGAAQQPGLGAMISTSLALAV